MTLSLRNARLLVLVVGCLLPWAVRLPWGWTWVEQYIEPGPGGWLLIAAANAIAWGAILLLSLLYRHGVSVLVAALPGFALLAWGHASLDLASDAQAALVLLVLPVLALVPIALGGVAGWVLDRRLRRAAAV